MSNGGGKDPCAVKAQALQLLTDGGSVPELVVLDLGELRISGRRVGGPDSISSLRGAASSLTTRLGPRADYTVWRVFVDSLAGPPFKFCDKRKMVVDRRNWEVELFPQVGALLQAFREANLKVALASRTEEPEWAEEVISIFKVDGGDTLVEFTHAREIYPTSKVLCRFTRSIVCKDPKQKHPP